MIAATKYQTNLTDLILKINFSLIKPFKQGWSGYFNFTLTVLIIDTIEMKSGMSYDS